MSIDTRIKFSFKKDWKLLFTKHDEVFEYKRYPNRDASTYKPLRIDWVIKYYLWQSYITVVMCIMRPFWMLCWKFWRLEEGEELTLSGKQLYTNPIRRYKL